MSEEHTGRGVPPAVRRPVGVRLVVYWCGRILQVIGLVLILEVLLLFAGPAGMGPLLELSLVAVFVFYAGWAGIMWATRKR